MRDSYLAHAEAAAVELALQIAQKVLGAAIAADPKAVLGIVSGALLRTTDRDHLVLEVNPADFELVRDAAAELAARMGGINRMEVVSERRVDRGGLRRSHRGGRDRCPHRRADGARPPALVRGAQRGGGGAGRWLTPSPSARSQPTPARSTTPTCTATAAASRISSASSSRPPACAPRWASWPSSPAGATALPCRPRWSGSGTGARSSCRSETCAGSRRARSSSRPATRFGWRSETRSWDGCWTGWDGRSTAARPSTAAACGRWRARRPHRWTGPASASGSSSACAPSTRSCPAAAGSGSGSSRARESASRRSWDRSHAPPRRR